MQLVKPKAEQEKKQTNRETKPWRKKTRAAGAVVHWSRDLEGVTEGQSRLGQFVQDRRKLRVTTAARNGAWNCFGG